MSDRKLPASRSGVALHHADGRTITSEIVKRIAMDVGKDTAAYIEVMYPEAVEAASSTFLLSLRNHVYNQIMAAIELNYPLDIEKRLADRAAFRRKWVGTYRKMRKDANA